MTESEYAIERTYATQELVNRLMIIVGYNLPALKPQLQSLWDDYTKVIQGIEDELTRTTPEPKPQSGPSNLTPEQPPTGESPGP